MTGAQHTALNEFLAGVQALYGTTLCDIPVFGSRARGDADPDSDLDLAIILKDGTWDTFDEKMRLTDLAYDALLATGLYIQSWPISYSAWVSNDRAALPLFVLGARRDARPVSEAA